MIKKIFICALLLFAVGCSSAQKNEITYTRDDFCLYAQPENGMLAPVVWLGMEPSQLDTENEYAQCFDEHDITFDNTFTSEGTATQFASFINYKGGIRKGMQTLKGIYSTGIYFNDEQPSSTGNDVITNYGLDPENESIFINKSDENNYTIALYFSLDEQQNVTRNIYPVGTDISNFSALDAKFAIRFVVLDNYVSTIQLIQKPTNQNTQK